MKKKSIFLLALTLMLAFAVFAGQGFGGQTYAQTDANEVLEQSDEIFQTDKALEQKVISKATLNNDFSENFIIITLMREESRNFLTYTPKDFPEIDCIGVEDLTEYTVDYVEQRYDKNTAQFQYSSNRDMLIDVVQESSKDDNLIQESSERHMLVDLDAFRRILCLEIEDGSKEKVLRSIKALETRSDVLAAEPDYLMKTTANSNATHYNHGDQWGLNGNNGINAPTTWDITSGSSSVIVGVLDTGIDSGHRDLTNRIHRSSPHNSTTTLHRDYTGNATNGTNIENPTDPNGHGTHVAGIIGAGINSPTIPGVTGVCWNVRLVSLRVLDANGSGFYRWTARAINYAASQNMPILNASLGGGWNSNSNEGPAMQTAIGSYTGLFVAAAGNDGVNCDTTRHYPSDFSREQTFSNRVISVGSIDNNGNPSSFSNRGANSVSIFAPGRGILSTFPTAFCNGNTRNALNTLIFDLTGIRTYYTCQECETEWSNFYSDWIQTSEHHADGYHFMSGTSMATPHVSGVAALMLSIFYSGAHGDGAVPGKAGHHRHHRRDTAALDSRQRNRHRTDGLPKLVHNRQESRPRGRRSLTQI